MMASEKHNLNNDREKKNKNIFARLINWIAEGSAKAQKGGGCVN